jgi:hypothetical protein
LNNEVMSNASMLESERRLIAVQAVGMNVLQGSEQNESDSENTASKRHAWLDP